MIKKIGKLYKKYEEIIKYLIIGFLTTVVSVISYAFFRKILNINYIVANVISWVLAVTFAYITNKYIVFKKHQPNYKKAVKEAGKFVGARVLTLLVDTLLMILLVEIIKIDDLIAKIIVQVIVIVSNYFISKRIVFK